MDVNDDAGCLDARVALTFFASKLAPTGGADLKARSAQVQVIGNQYHM